MVYNYLGINTNQSSQLDSCISYSTKNSLGTVELVAENTGAGELLTKLLSRMSVGDTLFINEITELGQTPMGVLYILSVLVLQGVKILSVKEGPVEPSLVDFINSLVPEVQSLTVESTKGRGQRMLLFG